ncbi:hypothetical protein RJ640_028525 [Escallonia rubra]|uniref:Prenyltransferase alpha-alpha toroid domain-containing protein n=1 Tax=Escallonia rubra TaxID=112253 RepID=A0AA88UVQ9_9ASTE|nr:hypothetical protein RJ640_028525 [Escallonia rubra]
MSGSAIGTDSPAAAAAGAETAAATPTVTQKDQWMVESQVFHTYQHYSSLPIKAQSVLLELQRDKHIEFLTKGLRQLGPSFSVLDANRPWLCYWIIHSIALLGDSVDDKLEESAIDFLNRCQDPEGGYGGGPGQASCFAILNVFYRVDVCFLVLRCHNLPHLATTYAAVNTLMTLGGYRSLSSVNRWSVFMTLKQFIVFSDKIYSFLLQMKHSSGGFRFDIFLLLIARHIFNNDLLCILLLLSLASSVCSLMIQLFPFRMHHGGEIDVRACYTAISPLKAAASALHSLILSLLFFLLNAKFAEELLHLLNFVDNFCSSAPVHRRVLMQVASVLILRMMLSMNDAFSYFKWYLESFISMQVASALNILDDELVQNVGNYILSCQTYEGGIAGEPGSEAHGGYTFCGFATMLLINEANRLDLARLIDWVVFRQGVEGGFQGRTNKLVDGCYSFWQVVFVSVRARVSVIVRIQH